MKPTPIISLKHKLHTVGNTVDEFKKEWTHAAINEINARLDNAASFGVRTADFSFGTLQKVVLDSEQDNKVKTNKHKLLNQIAPEIMTSVEVEFKNAGYNIRPVDNMFFVVEIPTDDV